MVVSSLMLTIHTDSRQEQLITAAECRTYTLPDGSSVYLERGSGIRFKDNFMEKRDIRLDGSATFEVRKMGNAPFRVLFGDAVIEVKGTCFTVDRKATGTDKIILHSGVIDFRPAKDGNTIEMLPSQILIYDRDNGTISMDTLPETIHWDKGRYCFERVRLKDLLDFVTGLYGTEIEMNCSEAGCERITGQIWQDENIGSVLDKICYSLDMKYDYDGRKYTLHK